MLVVEAVKSIVANVEDLETSTVYVAPEIELQPKLNPFAAVVPPTGVVNDTASS